MKAFYLLCRAKPTELLRESRGVHSASHTLLPKMGIRRIRIHRNSKEKYDELNEAVKWMRMPYFNAAEFIEDQIDKVLEQYEEFLKKR